MTAEKDQLVPANGEAISPSVRLILDALRGLQFGLVTVIVQDGVVVQVERTEKRRFARGGPKA